jgi:hypothetical protein
MRIFCIPDIHGRLDLFNKLWDKLLAEESLDLTQDKVIFLGDYCDRGDDTYGVICKLKDLVETYPNNIIALAGNHEYIDIMYFVRKSQDDIWLFENNGGPETLESYQRAGFSAMTQEHLHFLAHLPFKHEEPGFFFSHAPLPKDSYRNIILRGQPYTSDEHIWTYNSDHWGVALDRKNGIIGVSGHIHQLRQGVMSPRFFDHHYYLDCGAGCSPKAPLVAVEVKSKKVLYAWP